MQKKQDGQRGDNHPNFIFIFIKKLKIKILGAIWEILNTIGQIAKILNFGELDCKN